MRIKNLKIKNPIFLAPMAGVADLAFRTVVRDFGIGLVCSEMISAKAMHYGDLKTLALLETTKEERPFAVQLFGKDPHIIAEQAARLDADIVDLNFGCPAPKIVKNGEGSALLKDPALIGRIVEQTVKATKVPVTAKIRIGFDEHDINAVKVARIIEQSGAAAIAVHGRTTAQQYSGRADWAVISRVAECVNIPVIGNGDVDSKEFAEKMIKEAGVAAVMVGRAFLGAPWLFKGASGEQKHKTIMKHFELLVKYKGERSGILEARKHAAWYLKGIRGSAHLRAEVFKAATLSDMRQIFLDVTWPDGV